jgi:ABC-type antimicrobial peptide transport system permease subunit
MALGASRRDVAWVVLGRTLSLGVTGTLSGLLGAWWLSRYLGTLLDDIAVFDVTATAFAIVAVTVAVFAGAVTPLRRALTVDPADVMRE